MSRSRSWGLPRNEGFQSAREDGTLAGQRVRAASSEGGGALTESQAGSPLQQADHTQSSA